MVGLRWKDSVPAEASSVRHTVPIAPQPSAPASDKDLFSTNYPEQPPRYERALWVSQRQPVTLQARNHSTQALSFHRHPRDP